MPRNVEVSAVSLPRMTACFMASFIYTGVDRLNAEEEDSSDDANASSGSKSNDGNAGSSSDGKDTKDVTQSGVNGIASSVGNSPGSPSSTATTDSKDSRASTVLPFKQELALVADRFQLPELLLQCVVSLCNEITVENWAQHFLLADKIQSAQLKRYCLDMLREDRDRFHEILATADAKQLSKEQVIEMTAVVLPPKPSGKKRARPADLAADSALQPSKPAQRART